MNYIAQVIKDEDKPVRINRLKELTQNDFVHHLNNINYISNLIMIYNSTASVDATIYELNNLADAYCNDVINLNAFQNKIKLSCENYLSAIRNYIDSFAHSLSISYGKTSNIYNEFKVQKSNYYDSCFSYRLVEQIRNYCQHRGSPIHTIQSQSLNGKKTIVIQADTKVLCDDKNFKNNKLPELEIKCPKYIDLLEHFNVMYSCLKNINHIVFMKAYEEEKIRTIIKEAKSICNEKLELIIVDIEETIDGDATFKILGEYKINAVEKILDYELEIERRFFNKQHIQ